jgi:hypothetical protein
MFGRIRWFLCVERRSFEMIEAPRVASNIRRFGRIFFEDAPTHRKEMLSLAGGRLGAASHSGSKLAVMVDGRQDAVSQIIRNAGERKVGRRLPLATVPILLDSVFWKVSYA